MFQEFKYEVELTFTEEVLGTQPNNKEIYGDYIASKAPDATTIEDEIAAVGVTEVEEKGMTVFPRDEDGKPFIHDYQIRGFFKDACSALQRCKKSKNLSSNLKAYKKVIDGDIFVEGICFLITAALLFFADKAPAGKKTAGEMKYSDALIVGATQAFLAPLPGVSRSGSTISAGIMRGLKREDAVAFSFIIGIPPVLASNLLNIPDAIGAGSEVGAGVLLAGMAVSAVVGFLAIKLVRWLVKTDKFVWFAWYTAVLGVLTIAAAVIEKINGRTIIEMLAK